MFLFGTPESDEALEVRVMGSFVGCLPFRRIFAMPPEFDPEDGETIIEPLGRGVGWWAGACSALYDEATKRFYLYYRLRKPKELGRGAICRVAVSDDGINFTTIWEATREQFNSESIEKASLVKAPNGKWRLYISFVGENGKWRIEMMEADSPDGFKPSNRVKIISPDDVVVEGVKDPYVFFIGGYTFMLLSCAPRPKVVTAEVERQMHATADVYATGLTKSTTALATSYDGINFEWHGIVFEPSGDGWDGYATRISTLICDPPAFIAIYDGSATVEENYEEKTGIAFTFDLRNYIKVSVDAPWLKSPHSTGSLRYMDAVDMGEEVLLYYEYACPDGSHELRMSKLKRW